MQKQQGLAVAPSHTDGYDRIFILPPGKTVFLLALKQKNIPTKQQRKCFRCDPKYKKQFPYLPDVSWGNLPKHYLHVSEFKYHKESGISGYMGFVRRQDENTVLYHWIDETRSTLMTGDCAKSTTNMKGIYISEDDGKIYSQDYTTKKLGGTSVGYHILKKFCGLIGKKI